ncbi:MAG: hypothetical protein HYS12_29700 [Planctomycetes bacterium]|nr:hypothetical protein [Planctomycetota bacterium]
MEAALRALVPCSEALGRLEEAQKRYAVALAARPDDPETLHQAAGFFARQGQPARAEAVLRKLLGGRGTRDSGAGEASAARGRRELALVLAMQGGHRRCEEALALLGENAVKQQETVDDQRALAQDRVPEAHAHVEEAVRLEGPDAELLDTRALLHLKGGQPRRALADLEQAIEQSPSPMKSLHLALAYQRAGEGWKAGAALRKAVDAGWPLSRLPALEQSVFAELIAGLRAR